MSTIQATSIASNTAQGQYLGFSLQQVRLCYYLLSIPENESVSLEYADDVSVHHADGSMTLEQNKSALSGNPATDRSVDLWKTLANWADFCVKNTPANNSTFIYYVTPIKAGKIVHAIDSISTKSDAIALLNQIKNIKNKQSAKGNAPDIERFLSAGTSVCSQIICNFKFVTEDDRHESIRKLLRPVIPANSLEELCATAIGMARNMADDLISHRKKPIIKADYFRNRLRNFIKKHSLTGFLIPARKEPAECELAEIIKNSPLFIRQLRSVDATNDMILIASSDYLKTLADKTKWADDGNITQDSFETFSEDLIRRYAMLRDEIEDEMHTQNTQRRGRMLYRRCLDIQRTLENNPLPDYFVGGEYNALANIPRIWWHPDYQTLPDILGECDE